MVTTILFFLRSALLLLFGIVLSTAFCGIIFSKKNILITAGEFVVLGLVQLILFFLWDEEVIWYIYPLIVHFPLLLFLCLYYKRRFATVIAAVTTAYLCCQPAKWFAIFFSTLVNNPLLGDIIQIVLLLAVGFLVLYQLSAALSDIYNKDIESIYVFSIVPVAYYLFDYATVIYNNVFVISSRIISEFIPFLLCFIYLRFCVVYHREYEQRLESVNKARIIQLMITQQEKQLDAAKKSAYEVRRIRHDILSLMNSFSLAIQQNDMETAQKLISHYQTSLEETIVSRYCANDTLNYVLSAFADRCREQQIEFHPVVEISQMLPDEVMVASILSNALDNAYNAQLALPSSHRNISLMLKNQDTKLLISVKNPFKTTPVLVDGMPVSNRKGHGFGTESIRFLTEQLGGNCQFSVSDHRFILRIIL